MNTRTTASRISFLLLVTAISGFAFAPVAPARAAAAKTKRISVVAPYTDAETFLPDGITCSGLGSPDLTPNPDDPVAPIDGLMEHCELALSGAAQFAGGTIVGVTQYVEAGGMNTKGATEYHGPDAFDDGTIVGCGTGDFVLETYGGTIDFEHPHASESGDPRDTWFDGFNYWRLQPGSTSSEGAPFLLSGRGENHWKYYAFRTGNQSPIGVGEYTGTMTCVARER